MKTEAVMAEVGCADDVWWWSPQCGEKKKVGLGCSDSFIPSDLVFSKVRKERVTLAECEIT